NNPLLQIEDKLRKGTEGQGPAIVKEGLIAPAGNRPHDLVVEERQTLYNVHARDRAGSGHADFRDPGALDVRHPGHLRVRRHVAGDLVSAAHVGRQEDDLFWRWPGIGAGAAARSASPSAATNAARLDQLVRRFHADWADRVLRLLFGLRQRPTAVAAGA